MQLTSTEVEIPKEEHDSPFDSKGEPSLEATSEQSDEISRSAFSSDTESKYPAAAQNRINKLQRDAKKALKAALADYENSPSREGAVNVGVAYRTLEDYPKAIQYFKDAGDYGKYELACCYTQLFLQDRNQQYLTLAATALEKLLKIKKYNSDPSYARLWAEDILTDFVAYAKSIQSIIVATLKVIGSFGMRLPELEIASKCAHGHSIKNSCHTCIKAKVELARCYLYAVGTQERQSLAVWILKQAFTERFPDAMIEYAVAQRIGIGVKKDPKVAATLFRRFHKDDLRAQFLFGNCLAWGIGIAQDPDRGLAMMAAATEQGYSPRTLYSCDDFTLASKHQQLIVQHKADREIRQALSREKPKFIATSNILKSNTVNAIKSVVIFPFKVGWSVIATGWQLITSPCKKDPEKVRKALEAEIESENNVAKAKGTAKSPAKQSKGTVVQRSKQTSGKGKSTKRDTNDARLLSVSAVTSASAVVPSDSAAAEQSASDGEWQVAQKGKRKPKPITPSKQSAVPSSPAGVVRNSAGAKEKRTATATGTKLGAPQSVTPGLKVAPAKPNPVSTTVALQQLTDSAAADFAKSKEPATALPIVSSPGTPLNAVAASNGVPVKPTALTSSSSSVADSKDQVAGKVDVSKRKLNPHAAEFVFVGENVSQAMPASGVTAAQTLLQLRTG